MWRMLQHDTPSDYVLATGEVHTVRDFCRLAFARAGMDLEFRGSGADETAIDSATGREVIAIDPRYFRPTEVDLLLG
jgi:GDPmannose 4,6-dehydratase